MILSAPHYLTILIFLLLFVLLAFIVRNEEKQTLALMLPVTFVLMGALTVAALYGIDGVIKKGALINVSKSRLYDQEKLIIQGTVANKGSYAVGKCSLKVTVSHVPDVAELGDVKSQLDTQFGSQSTFLQRLKAFVTGQTIIEGERLKTSYTFEETVSGPLAPGDAEEFTLSFPLPGAVQNPKYQFDLTCH